MLMFCGAFTSALTPEGFSALTLSPGKVRKQATIMAAAPFDKLKILANLSINRLIWLLIVVINFTKLSKTPVKTKYR